MEWFRWYTGTFSDPKWRVIARKSGARLSDVVAVWAAVCEAANASERRGTLDSFADEDIAAALDLDTETVNAIWGAMDGKVRDGLLLTGWAKRQPKREDGSADRARRWREEQKERTQPNAGERIRPLEESREEKIVEKEKEPSVPKKNRRAALEEWVVKSDHQTLAHSLQIGDAVLGAEAAKFRDYALNRRDPYKDLDAAFRNWLREAGERMKRGRNGNGKPPADAQTYRASTSFDGFNG